MSSSTHSIPSTPKSEPDTQTPPKTIETTHPLKGLKLAILLGSITLVTFLALLDTSIVGTAIPVITTQFHSLSDIGWYVGAYTLAAATLQPLSGKLYTYFPSKIVYLGFVGIFELGSLICGVAPSSKVLIVGRAVAGLGVSGIVNGGLTILAGSVEREKSPLYTGILIGTAQMGVVAGPLIGGALTEHASWRWCFYINLPIGGVAAAIFAFISIPESTKKEAFSLSLVRKVIPELDLIGFAIFGPASIMFLLALQFGSGNDHAWNSATVIGLFIGAGLMGIIFICWERRIGDRAMLPGSLLKRRIVWVSAVYGLCNTCCMITASNWIPTYFQAVTGDTPTLSGVHVLPSILSQLLCVITSGALMSKMGYYLPWAFASAIVMAIGNGLVSTFKPTTTVAQWIGYQVVLGAGRGLGMQTSLIGAQNAAPPAQIPVAMAFLIFCQNFGTSVGIVLSNTIFTETLTRAIPHYAPSVSPQAALDAGSGAGAVRHLVVGHEDDLNGVLLAYSESLRNIFYFLVGMSAIAVVASLGMGWVDVRKKKDGPKMSGDVEVQQEAQESKGQDKT